MTDAGRYRGAVLSRRLSNAAIVVGVLLSACTHPLPGVLTLAPAGMRTTGSCTPNQDGTLVMSAGASADSVVYADAGGVTIAVTAHLPPGQPPVALEVWFAGSSIGTAQFDSLEAQTVTLHTRVRVSGPTALRIVLQNTAGTDPALHVEKVVITEP